MAGIQSAGGIKALKKVDRTKVKDRSAAMVPGADTDSGPAGGGGGSGAPGGGGGGMQDALAAALAKRKKKIVDSGKWRGLVGGMVGFELTFVQMMRKIRMMMIGKLTIAFDGVVTSG